MTNHIKDRLEAKIRHIENERGMYISCLNIALATLYSCKAGDNLSEHYADEAIKKINRILNKENEDDKNR